MNPGRNPSVLHRGTTAGMFSPVEGGKVEDYKVWEAPEAPTGKKGAEVPEHLRDLWQRSVSGMDPGHVANVTWLLSEFADVFSKGDGDLGRTDLVKHRIETGDARPIRQRLRRQPACNQEEIARQVDGLLDRGIVEPSDSPWASNVVLVRKKDGSQRFCVV